MAECSFCGEKIKPGTGFLYVKKDGTALFFCSRKCEKNLLKLKRKPIATKWTKTYAHAKELSKAGSKKVKKVKVVEKKEKPTKVKKKKVRKKKKR